MSRTLFGGESGDPDRRLPIRPGLGLDLVAFRSESRLKQEHVLLELANPSLAQPHPPLLNHRAVTRENADVERLATAQTHGRPKDL